MIWTKDKPTEPGHYWYRDEHGEDIVFVFKRSARLSAMFCCVGEIEYNLDHFTKGEWSSETIPMPTEILGPEISNSTSEEQH